MTSAPAKEAGLLPTHEEIAEFRRWLTRAPSPSPDQPAGEDKAALIRDLTARAEAAEGRVLDAAAAYLIDTYGASYGLDHPVDRRRILAALATEAKDGRAG